MSESQGEPSPAITKAQIRKRVQNANRGTPNANQGNIQESMWKFYSGDSPGMKIGPVPVLVVSLLFIGSVFIMHMWSKYNRLGS